ncbi:hypothetical protein PBI_TRISCUIT_2 [Microbacterium phage Triscuit]|nr:hypothetical protein PBI_TRISCUIT_107 [Microbacterium phage Triscuit]AVR56979.1 hypothetical protein PBI_TRISCUIT_2 [Microbacterium phage Triscuit]
MARIDQIEITPTTLAKLGQALDYRYRLRKKQYDEDGADLMDTIGILYKELGTKHLQTVYGQDAVKMTGAPTAEELQDALTTLEQFDMLKLLYKDESGVN